MMEPVAEPVPQWASELLRKVDGLCEDMVAVKEDMVAVKEDMAAVKEGLATVKEDVRTLNLKVDAR